jgi:hypothetical protein
VFGFTLQGLNQSIVGLSRYPILLNQLAMISHNDGTRGILLYELIACPTLIELDGTLRNGNQLELVLKF